MARAAAQKVKARKRLTGDERRRSILEAALDCFLEKGYIATTINDIREASGATTGSIYHFFDGKVCAGHGAARRRCRGLVR